MSDSWSLGWGGGVRGGQGSRREGYVVRELEIG